MADYYAITLTKMLTSSEWQRSSRIYTTRSELWQYWHTAIEETKKNTSVMTDNPKSEQDPHSNE